MMCSVQVFPSCAGTFQRGPQPPQFAKNIDPDQIAAAGQLLSSHSNNPVPAEENMMRLTGILDRISRHADLFEAMIDRLGLRQKIYGVNDAPAVLRRANMRCLSCSSAGACETWLGEVAEASEPPDYCRNKALFARLERLQGSGNEPDCHGSGSSHLEQAL